MIRKAIIMALLMMPVVIYGCARPAEVKVSMKNFLYTPKEVTINVGDKITWTNDDIEPHTVTTDDWDSGTIDVGQSYSRVFTTPGTYQIRCVFHPDMLMKVTVVQRGGGGARY